MRVLPAYLLKSLLLKIMQVPSLWLERVQQNYTRQSSSSMRVGALWWGYFPVFVVAMLGITNTIYFYRQVSNWERQQVATAFEQASNDRVLVVRREMEYALATVRDIATYFEASSEVRRREFRKFVEPAIKRQQGIEALEWVPYVTHQERESFEQEARKSFPLLDQGESGYRRTCRGGQPR